jgi:hypothetical protein
LIGPACPDLQGLLRGERVGPLRADSRVDHDDLDGGHVPAGGFGDSHGTSVRPGAEAVHEGFRVRGLTWGQRLAGGRSQLRDPDDIWSLGPEIRASRGADDRP